ncbi:MAG: M23 family metallopeptidase [Candidatus Thioglobus sp.]|nr:MAG: M23 family metallopeptidase [Candidatus Thioglobus sp.]
MENFIPKLKKLKKISLLLLLLPSLTLANIIIENTPIPGGIAVLDFDSNKSNPRAFYKSRPLFTQHIDGEHWQALLGIPLWQKMGKIAITIKDFSTRTLVVDMKNHQYEEQHITLKGDKKKYVNPNAKYIQRINKERPILSKARVVFSTKILADELFIRPVDGITTSPFGLKRFYNGEPRRAHTGLDYAGDIGTKIKAPAAGKIILTGNFFFNGNAIFIDHGQGLISVYIHTHKILVKQGQMVKQGDIIGTIGQSGRATGPHLHWGVYLNGIAINPNLLLENQER